MGPVIEKMIAKAVVTYLNGDYTQFRSWTSKAMKELEEQKRKNQLHATIGEIMEYKKIRKRRTDYEQIN